MKIRYINYLLILALIIVGACAENSSVGLIPPDDTLPPTQQETFTNTLTSSSWNIGQDGTVTRDNVDVTDQFAEFVVSFKDDFTYTSSGGGDLWPDGSGTWQFASESGISQIIVGGVEMSVNLASGQLNLSFNIADPEGAIQGRVANLTGEYIIILFL